MTVERSRIGTALRGLALSGAVVACDWTRALESDPEAWAPATTVAGSSEMTSPDDAGPGGSPGPGDADTTTPGCAEEPPYEPSLRQSSPTAISHRASERCLEGCHEAGGNARLIFAVAGTVHRADGDRTPVTTGGTIHAVAGTTLTLDRCGNFYAVASVLATQPQLTQPFVQNPTLHRMEKPLVREKSAGSCNQTSCHDFSSSSKSGT